MEKFKRIIKGTDDAKVKRKRIARKCITTIQFPSSGVIVGRLCVPHQPDPAPRASSDAAGAVLRARVRGVQHAVLRRHHPLHADLLRGLPARAELGAHAGTSCL